MVKIEKITRGEITISYKGQYYHILGEGLLLTKDNTYSYIIYRNSIDNTLSPIEQETILQAIIEHFGSKGQKVLIE
ncbi:Imm74 family immunity protein [Capnocytophaga gingivalis]|uniref:Imm74 family immunity protein n=1 Tax=Capnocytophaga gingivalis TaxID=1017 RepID=UPI0023F91F9C|nr:Imm74 family immunity protein [Capnocytophaga gingivalis]